VFRLGGDISAYVPENVRRALDAKRATDAG
jgi:phosphopantetheine adenylyltransferase